MSSEEEILSLKQQVQVMQKVCGRVCVCVEGGRGEGGGRGAQGSGTQVQKVVNSISLLLLSYHSLQQLGKVERECEVTKQSLREEVTRQIFFR
jgi:hypothetical protein